MQYRLFCSKKTGESRGGILVSPERAQFGDGQGQGILTLSFLAQNNWRHTNNCLEGIKRSVFSNSHSLFGYFNHEHFSWGKMNNFWNNF